MKKLHKFTLIELLIIVAIIGILASLLVPALGKARAKARMAVCIKNMKQISLGIMMYCDSNDGTPYHTYRSIQNDLDNANILKIDGGAWECPEDKGTWVMLSTITFPWKKRA